MGREEFLVILGRMGVLLLFLAVTLVHSIRCIRQDRRKAERYAPYVPGNALPRLLRQTGWLGVLMCAVGAVTCFEAYRTDAWTPAVVAGLCVLLLLAAALLMVNKRYADRFFLPLR